MVSVRERELPWCTRPSYGRFDTSGAATRSAVVMKGFSTALRHAINRHFAVSLAACRRFENAWTGSSKNMTPKREMITSKLLGSNGYVCAFARTKTAGMPSRSERAWAAVIIGSEMSMPRSDLLVRAIARQPTLRSRSAADIKDPASRSAGNGVDEQAFERFEHVFEKFLRVDPTLAG